MNKELIKQSIQNYIKTPRTDYAIMLTGEWGVGKTHLIKNHFLNVYKNDFNWLYLSLNGVEKLEEIKSRFISNIIDTTSDDNLESVLENVNLNLGFVNNLNVGKIFTFFKEKHYTKVESSSISNKNLIVIFDDLERINFNIIECFGYISTYFLEKGIKVIIISNENEIKSNDNFKDYMKIKEKVIQYTYTIDNIIDLEVLQSISSYLNNNIIDDFINDNLIEIINKCNIKNLRLIKFIFERYYTILANNNDVKYDYSQKLIIFKNVLLFSNEYKKENGFKEVYKPFCESIINVNSINFSLSFNKNDGIFKDYTYILDKEFYLFPSIYKYVFENYNTYNLNDEFDSYKYIFENEYTKALNNLFIYGLIDNVSEVLSIVYEGIKKNIYSLSNLYEINKFIYYISHNYKNIVSYSDFEYIILNSIQYLESTDNLPKERISFFKDDVPSDNAIKNKIIEINSRLEELNLKKELNELYKNFKIDSSIEFSELSNKVGYSRNLFDYIDYLEFGTEILKIKPAERSYYAILSFNDWLNNILGFDNYELIFDIYEKLSYIFENFAPESISDLSERIRATNLKNNLKDFINNVKIKLSNNANYQIDSMGRIKRIEN